VLEAVAELEMNRRGAILPNFCLTVGIAVAGVRLISWLAAEAGERQRDRRAGRQGRGPRCRRGARQCGGRRLALRAPAWEHTRWAYIYVTLLGQGGATAHFCQRTAPPVARGKYRIFHLLSIRSWPKLVHDWNWEIEGVRFRTVLVNLICIVLRSKGSYEFT